VAVIRPDTVASSRWTARSTSSRASRAITGTRRAGLLGETLAGTPVNAAPGYPAAIAEVFLLEGPRLLQLTNFRRVDTGREFLSVNGRRAFFHASADPLGTNPTENCQLFSIDTLGRHLRQLTHFREGERSVNGCQDGPPPGCGGGIASQDPVTGTGALTAGRSGSTFPTTCLPLVA
jgi:hypothetical protein